MNLQRIFAQQLLLVSLRKNAPIDYIAPQHAQEGVRHFPRDKARQQQWPRRLSNCCFQKPLQGWFERPTYISCVTKAQSGRDKGT